MLKKIEDLSSGSAISLTDRIPVVQPTSPAKYITGTQIQTFIRQRISSSSSAIAYNNSTGVFSVGTGYTIPTNSQLASFLSTAILSLNGLTSATQTFAKGTTAQSNDWGIVSASGVHTFHFPDASSSDRGLLTSDDWSTFNSKFDSTGGILDGVIEFKKQGSTPSSPALGSNTVYTSSSGLLTILNHSGYIYEIDNTGLTANRSVTLPNATGTMTLGTGAGANSLGIKPLAYWNSANFVTYTSGIGYMAGLLYSVGTGGSYAGFAVVAPDTNSAGIKISTGNGTSTESVRWYMGKDTTTESSTATGADFKLKSYDNTGVYFDTPLTIERATSKSTFSGHVSLGTSGKMLMVKGGAATDSVGTIELVSGTLTINNTNILTGDIIMLTRRTANGSTAIGELTYTISNATSFTVTSKRYNSPTTTETNDVSILHYQIIRPI